MIGVFWWQGLLNALGWVLSHIYDGVHNYGLAIIILTLGIRLLLLPLGLKQIRSMQAMQTLQPQIKSLQQNPARRRQHRIKRVILGGNSKPCEQCLLRLAGTCGFPATSRWIFLGIFLGVFLGIFLGVFL